MNKYIRRIGILIVVFVLAGGSYLLMNRQKEDETVYVTMDKAAFPVLKMVSGERSMNELHGYAEPMEGASIRDSVTVLNGDRGLSCEIHTFGQPISGLTYEIRSLDGGQLIQKSEGQIGTAEDNVITLPFSIQNLIAQDTEYLMILILNTPDREMYYYTRILWTPQPQISSLIDFALDFSSKTFVPEQAKGLAVYLETDAQADNTDLGRVTIRSSLSQITWGGLPVQRVGEPSVKVMEAGTNTGDIQLKYQVTLETGEGNPELYDITEAFCLKRTADRIYLMSYERTMNQIFEAGSATIKDSKINLGISYGSNLEAMSSKEGDFTAFVSNRSLWSYNKTGHKAVQVFTFRDGTQDIRTHYDQYDIKVVSVDDLGNVDFIVYGYMNRGRHEGYVGLSYYKYDAKENTLEEKFYIPSEESYGMLHQDMGTLSYITDGQHFYFMLRGSIYAVDLTGREHVVVAEGLKRDEFMVSVDNKRIAWIQEYPEERRSRIHMMNLETGLKQTIDSQSGELLRVLGFVEEDLVYGIARYDDIEHGDGQIPMYAVEIIDDDLSLQKHYEMEGVYITGVRILDTRIWMEQSVIGTGGSFEPIGEDTLVLNQTIATVRHTGVSKEKSERKKSVYYINTKTAAAGNKNLSVQSPEKILKSEVENTIILPKAQGDSDKFYAYSYGMIKGIYENVSDAVESVYDTMGTVTDGRMELIWSRVNKLPSKNNPADSAVQYVEGKNGLELLLDAHPDRRAISAEGCTLNQVLSFVSSGRTVLAVGSGDAYYLLTGYDQFNVTLYNLKDGSTSKMGLNDGGNYFSSSGNRFYTYVER